MAASAIFYHMTRSQPETTLPLLLAKSLEKGWRVVVRGTDRAAMERLDAQLWLDPAGGFLPHGLEGGPHDADQPVLLTCGRGQPNAAACLIAVGGADVTAEEAAGLERLCVLFDGNDEAAVAHARQQWTALTAAGLAAEYWNDDSGRWQKKAER